MELTARLKSVYSLLPQGCVMIDVGTDHCHLPIYALQQRRIQKAYASDVRKGPLENGRSNAEIYGVNHLITTLLSDGLSALTPSQQKEIDTVVCAGMGGTLIQNIIVAAPFLKDKSKTLILQPQKAIYELKEYLASEGFVVEKEVLSIEGDKMYQCMKVHFDGVARKAPNPFEAIKNDSLFPQYYEIESHRLQKQKSGMEQGGIPDKNRYDEVCLLLAQLEEVK